jgi:cystathionine beta-synthase
MIERGFLDVKTFKDIISARGTMRLISVEASKTVAEAVELMKKNDIEHIPVMNARLNDSVGQGNGLIGSISEGGLFQKIFDNPEIKNSKIADVLEPSFPIVSFDTPLEKLSKLINKENGAVLAQDDAGNFHIVTKYDVIQALGS